MKFEKVGVKGTLGQVLDKVSTIEEELIKITKTAHFNRLRSLHQLGADHYVFKEACHKRFEHCVGTAELALRCVRAIQTKQPELNIDERDVYCVAIAALCHDLGHGPFSHLFDGLFLPNVLEEGEDWNHEIGSSMLFDDMLEKYPELSIKKGTSES